MWKCFLATQVCVCCCCYFICSVKVFDCIHASNDKFERTDSNSDFERRYNIAGCDDDFQSQQYIEQRQILIYCLYYEAVGAYPRLLNVSWRANLSLESSSFAIDLQYVSSTIAGERCTLSAWRWENSWVHEVVILN